jgi:hypothetical protein
METGKVIVVVQIRLNGDHPKQNAGTKSGRWRNISSDDVGVSPDRGRRRASLTPLGSFDLGLSCRPSRLARRPFTAYFSFPFVIMVQSQLFFDPTPWPMLLCLNRFVSTLMARDADIAAPLCNNEQPYLCPPLHRGDEHVLDPIFKFFCVSAFRVCSQRLLLPQFISLDDYNCVPDTISTQSCKSVCWKRHFVNQRELKDHCLNRFAPSL